jgi:hypothetical protein
VSERERDRERERQTEREQTHTDTCVGIKRLVRRQTTRENGGVVSRERHGFIK